jgi:hypothetical protein
MLTAEQLGITPEELLALRQVRELLTKQQLHHDERIYSAQGLAFNMSTCGRDTECGTVACIGGWMHILMEGTKPNEQGFYLVDADHAQQYVCKMASAPLFPLFFPIYADAELHISQALVPEGVKLLDVSFKPITSEMAIQAIDNFLTTGKPDWWSIVKDHRDIVDIEEDDDQ